MNNRLRLRRDGESLTEWTLRFLREAQEVEGSVDTGSSACRCGRADQYVSSSKRGEARATTSMAFDPTSYATTAARAFFERVTRVP